MIVCNVRNLAQHLTGVQRYTSELLARFPDVCDTIAPPARWSSGVRGHAWEQIRLPTELGGRLLWSPSNTGPLAVRRQALSVMDMSPLDHPEWMSARFARWYQFLLPRLIERVQLILTISEFSRERILHHCPDAKGKIHVTHLAADARFQPQPQDVIAAMRSQLDLPNGRYLVALGSLEPRKNLGRLLAAWERVSPSMADDVWLILAGAKGKRLVFAEQAIDRLPPRVHLTGHVPDLLLPALYSGALGTAYLSLYEGFGLPPLEAMACGTPVICSRAGSLPEVVGSAALTVDPTRAPEIEQALLALVESAELRADLSQRGISQAALFTWQATAAKTWSLLVQSAED